MLIPTIGCVTGSVAHHDRQRSAIQLKKHIYVISGIYTADCVTAVAAIVIGMCGFFHIPGLTINLPLSVKITLIVGGTAFCVGDSVYLIYRLKKASKEVKDQIHNLNVKDLEKLDANVKQVTENIDNCYAMIQRYEQKYIPMLQKLVNDTNQFLLQAEVNEDYSLVDKNVGYKKKAEYELAMSLVKLKEMKAQLAEQLELSEALESARRISSS